MWLKRHKKRVMVIGLDCAEPELVFHRWREHLPNIRALMQDGLHGRLRSCDPPITVPAWSVMMSSKSPGTLGIYGFRNRADRSYTNQVIANSTVLRTDRLWDILSRAGKRVVLIGIPQTFPPQKVNGILVADFLTPDTKSDYTYPPDFKDEISRVVGEYILDVREFRSDKKDAILRDIHEMTRKRFELARHLLAKEDWDFFMMVEIGVDRIHHAFWAHMDKTHRKHSPGSPFENAIFDYYKFVDGQIGELLKSADNQTAVLVVSDHGAKKMEGAIHINEWLIREGFLVLLEKPETPTPFSKLKIDWPRTEAWGDGGYYARIFLNVKGREQQGAVHPSEYENLRAELVEKIEAIPDEAGRPIGTKVYRPEQLYKTVNGIAPDLLAYFGDLAWRSAGSAGVSSIHSFENDTGPDEANHAQHGIFIMKDGSRRKTAALEDLEIRDVSPTILKFLGVAIPGDMEGKVI